MEREAARVDDVPTIEAATAILQDRGREALAEERRVPAGKGRLPVPLAGDPNFSRKNLVADRTAAASREDTDAFPSGHERRRLLVVGAVRAHIEVCPSRAAAPQNGEQLRHTPERRPSRVLQDERHVGVEASLDDADGDEQQSKGDGTFLVNAFDASLGDRPIRARWRQPHEPDFSGFDPPDEALHEPSRPQVKPIAQVDGRGDQPPSCCNGGGETGAAREDLEESLWPSSPSRSVESADAVAVEQAAHEPA